jgi:UDPglucose 6-dehydrogenase
VIPLAAALAADERIGGPGLSPGLGFGGGCLPKDIRAFRATARALGVGSLDTWLGEVDAINLSRRSRVTDLAREITGGTLAGQHVAVLGIAFKPGSDDVRDSPSLAVCGQLTAEGATVSVHDPAAAGKAARVRPDLRYARTVTEAAAGADALLHLTDWADYRAIDPVALGAVVARRNVVDARCALDRELWRAAGWTVRVPGRP